MNTKKIITMILLAGTLVFFAARLSAQDKRHDFSLFTMELPEKLYLLRDDTEELGCYTICTEERDFLCTICFFPIDEDFELLDRLREEASELDIDLDEAGYFGITTGTPSPLLCTAAEFDGFALIMGIYPNYDEETGIFVCLSDAKDKDIGNLMFRMSSFRLKE